jgi:GT2 family glycosyltransferase
MTHQPGGAEAPHVVTVVLNWNGREDTLRCLESLGATTWPSHTTLLVDNASSDGTCEAVEARFPSVRVIRNEKNLGFAGGNNVGLREALALDADFAFVLNNDTILDATCIERLVAEARRLEPVGAVCPLILSDDPRSTVWFAGATFDPRRGRSGRMLGYGVPDDGRYRGTRETERATGAAMLMPEHALRTVGLFDEELFLQYEDVDLSLRMRAAGLPIYVASEARVIHRVSRSSGGEHSPLVAYFVIRNHVAVCERHAPLGALRSGWRRLVALLVSLVRVRRASRRARCLHAIALGFRDVRRGRLGPAPEALT